MKIETNKTSKLKISDFDSFSEYIKAVNQEVENNFIITDEMKEELKYSLIDDLKNNL